MARGDSDDIGKLLREVEQSLAGKDSAGADAGGAFIAAHVTVLIGRLSRRF